MAYDYLVDHALRNVWCTPDQDMQAVVKPARLTPLLGVFNKVTVMWRTHALPLAQTRFHVYQIGQLHPALMGLFPIQLTWNKLSNACEQMSLIADVYNIAGVQLPRTEVWYMVTFDRNLILAVKDQPRVPVNLTAEDIFVRVYSNEYFNSLRADTANDVIVCKGGTCRNTDEILALQVQYLTYKAKPGLVSAYVNGFLVDQIDLITVVPGDVAEFVYDSSVKRVVEWTVGDLQTFSSTLDSKHKYLLHYPGAGDNTIDFHDDVDFFVLKPATGGRYSGVMYHRNMADAVRMITHRDYSVVPAYVVSYADARGGAWADVEALKIRATIRKSGWLRPLVNEDNRIKELYKLSEPALVNALLGLDAVVENWTAAVLEASFYSKLMRASINEVNRGLVEDAYGYNALSCLLAMTPGFTREANGQQVIDVPVGLQRRATGYEYDVNGQLLGWFSHVSGETYPARDIRAKLVEMIAGEVSDRLDETYGEPTQLLDPKANYRMYRCPMVGGLPNNIWEDVTDSGNYALIDGALTWLLDPTEYYTLVRSDKISLGYSLTLDASDGLLDFSLSHRQLRFGELGVYVMQIPMGELDLWLNGKALIEGLDYVVKFPKVVITNKEYLVNPDSELQRVDVRFCGFCKPDFSRDVPEDVGFVMYGHLSHNNRFDIRDDKVMRIVVNGALYDRSELQFREDSAAVEVADARNGSPYMIRDLVVPMRGYTNKTTYELRAHSQEIDQRVSDYLTLKAPELNPEEPSASTQYTVYSPFVNKILRDLQRGILDDPRLKQHYNDNVVLELCQPYEWLLEYDPSQDANVSDERFVLVHPHNLPTVLDVDIYHYKFISRVVALYCNGRVNLSHLLRLAEIS